MPKTSIFLIFIFILTIFIETILLYKKNKEEKKKNQELTFIREKCHALEKQLEQANFNNKSLEEKVQFLSFENIKITQDCCKKEQEYYTICCKLEQAKKAEKALKDDLEGQTVANIFKSSLIDGYKEEIEDLTYTISNLERQLFNFEKDCKLSELEVKYHKNASFDLSIEQKYITETRNFIKKHILRHAKDCFELSSSIMSPVESRIYYSLIHFLEKVSQNRDYTYHVFPQVSMHVLIDAAPNSRDAIINNLSKKIKIEEETLKKRYSLHTGIKA